MKRYLLFPEGFDPMVAAGPPDDRSQSWGLTWALEETEAMRELESQAVVVYEKALKDRWYRELE